MGLLITFEGVEGSGKSTQIELLKASLEARGRDVLTLREPGGTRLGEEVRRILLGRDGDGMEPLTELLLYSACRSEIITKVIRPALQSGKTVICDRFTDSTIAYQGYARELDPKTIETLNKLVTSGLRPDITFLLDMDPKKGLKRAIHRMSSVNSIDANEDRFERESLQFHGRVREGFLKLASADPERIKLIDAERSIEEIQSDIERISIALLSR